MPHGLELLVEHRARVRVVGLDDEQARVALLEQELVLEALSVEVDVRQVAAVDVVAFDVVLEPHELPVEASPRVRRSLGPVALHRLGGMVRLGRVNAQESNRVAHAAAFDHDRVTVEHLDDAVLLIGRASLLTGPPPHHRGGGQHGDHHDGTRTT